MNTIVDMSAAFEAFRLTGMKQNKNLMNGEPVFNASEIGRCVGIGASAISQHIKNVPHIHKIFINHKPSKSKQGRKMWFLSESGMYQVMLRCKSAMKEGTQANRFFRYVCDVILPELRKTGRFEVEQLKTRLHNTQDELEDTNLALRDANADLQDTNDELAETLRILEMGISNIVIDTLQIARRGRNVSTRRGVQRLKYNIGRLANANIIEQRGDYGCWSLVQYLTLPDLRHQIRAFNADFV